MAEDGKGSHVVDDWASEEQHIHRFEGYSEEGYGRRERKRGGLGKNGEESLERAQAAEASRSARAEGLALKRLIQSDSDYSDYSDYRPPFSPIQNMAELRA